MEEETRQKFAIEIESACNGFITRSSSGEVEVFEHDISIQNDMNQGQEVLSRVLYEVLSYFGASGSKHDKARLVWAWRNNKSYKLYESLQEAILDRVFTEDEVFGGHAKTDAFIKGWESCRDQMIEQFNLDADKVKEWEGRDE